MAAAVGQPDRSLSAALRGDHARFDFYQLVRLLLRERVTAAQPRPALERVVRFRTDHSLAFPATEVTRVDDAAGQPATVTTPNYGVAGYLGPLPESFGEWVQQRKADGDPALADFLDLFAHRLNALRFRLKARAHPVLDNQTPERSIYAAPLAAIAGFAPAGVATQLPVAPRALLGIAGVIGNRRRTAAMIEQVLARYLDARVRVVPFRGGWHRLPASSLTALGRRNHRLGGETVLGAKAWDQSAGIDVRIGPVAYARFRALLPGGAEHARFAALLRFLTDRQVDCHVCVAIDAPTIPPSELQATPGLQLAQSAWLASGARATREVGFVVPAYEEAARAA